MKKTLKRILIRGFFISITLIIAVVSVILNPQMLFAQKTVYRDFAIYSNDKIPGSYTTTIDAAIELIKTSELYRPNEQINIFLCSGTMFNDIDTKLLGPAMARCVDDNILLKVPVDFDKNILIGGNSKRNLKKTIAHEAIHFYQMKKIGMLKLNLIVHPPIWKTEGYAEYISNQSELRSKEYDLKHSIEKLERFEKDNEYWVETEPGQLDPLIYYKGRVLMEYLVDIKHLNFSQIFDDKLEENEVVIEMKQWYNRQ